MPADRQTRSVSDGGVWRYYCYQASLSMGFYVPVSDLYLLDSGFGVGFVGLAFGVFSLSLLVAEVPAGYLADRVGRRWTLLLGSLCRTVGMVGYVVGGPAVVFLAAKVLFGLGWAFRSGTTDAYLYELLGRNADKDRFATVRGRGQTALLGTSAVAAVAGGLLYGVDPRLPFLANAALTTVGLPVLLSFPETTDEESDPFTLRDAVGTLRTQARRPELRWIVVYSVLVLLAFDLTRTYEQPALRAVGVDAATLGVLYAAFKLFAAGAGSAVGPLQNRFGTRSVLLALPAVVGVAYAGLLAVPALLLPVSFLYRASRTVLLPVRNDYLNGHLDDAGRATVLSGASMVLSLFGAGARFLTGFLVPATGPVALIGLAGVALSGVALVVWTLTRPVKSEDAQALAKAAD